MNKAAYFKSLYIVLLITIFVSCNEQKDRQLTDSIVEDTIKVAFYNVENLFDTDDDPFNQGDDEFTPSGKLKWTPERYMKKLSLLSRVIEAMEFPAIIGLVEIENKKVLNDWISMTTMTDHHYRVAHLESNDYRGIDAGLLYRANAFEILKTENFVISFPNDPGYRTRDIFCVNGVLENKDTLTIFINHFPSRRGGQAESEPKRIYVATQLSQLIENVFAENDDAKIIVMGDFNDEPFNQSISGILGAEKYPQSTPQTLYNPMWSLTEKGLGSYNYRDNWQMLDQIIMSGELLDEDDNYRYLPGSAKVFKKDWMLQQTGDYKGYPDRTYAGDNYLGGYSDHLPVFLELYLPE